MPTEKLTLTAAMLKNLKPGTSLYEVRDAGAPGLRVRIYPNGLVKHGLLNKVSIKEMRVGNTSRFDKKIAFKWFIFLLIAFGIYGLTVFNFGTAVRYKFPFVVIIVIGMAHELYLKHGKLILNKDVKS